MKKQLIAATLSLLAISATAQNTRSGYFIDNYTYRFELNPAFGLDKNFVATPGIGNLNVALNGNIGLSDVFYNVNGKTTTFLNPNISAATVMNNLKDNNRVGSDIKITVLAGGFKAWGGYNTVAVNARASLGVKVPKSIFSLMKEGVSNKEYDITDIRAFGNAYAELALNHSRDINKEWRVGAAMKFLIGGANVDARLNNARLNLAPDGWHIIADGHMNANIKGFTYKTKYDEDYDRTYVDGMDVDGTGVNGFGLAWDLGVVYSPEALPDWKFSFAMLDLGFIHWSNNVEASTNGVKEFVTNDYTFNADEDMPNGFDNEWDRVKDDFTALYELEDNGDLGGQTRSLGATMNVGVEYTLPMYKALKFGLLNTTRIQGAFSWTDFRLSANIAPAKVIDGGINFAAGTFGCSFGWLVNLHAGAYNMFVGMDHTMGKLCKQGVPLSSNAQINFGINWLF